MSRIAAILLIGVLLLQFSMMKWEMLSHQRHGRPLWLALIPVVSLVVIAYDAIADRFKARG